MNEQNLQNCCQLHESIQVIYVVDGYEAQLWTKDDNALSHACFGKTIQEALEALDAILQGKTLENIRGKKKRHWKSICVWAPNIHEVKQKISQLDPKAEFDPEENPITFWVLTALKPREIRMIPYVQDAKYSI